MNADTTTGHSADVSTVEASVPGETGTETVILGETMIGMIQETAIVTEGNAGGVMTEAAVAPVLAVVHDSGIEFRWGMFVILVHLAVTY